MELAKGKNNFMFNQAITNVRYINPDYIRQISGDLTQEELETLYDYSGKVLVFKYRKKEDVPAKSSVKSNTILASAAD